MTRSWRALAIAVVALVLACPTAFAARPSPGAHPEPGTPVDLGSPAAQLRVDLDRLLAEHAFLTIEQMRSGLIGGPDFQAAATAVEGNSTDVAAAIGSIYGDAAVDPFGEIWRSHIGYLVDYAVALGDGNTAGQQSALSGLAAYRTNLRTFLANANPGVDLAEISDALDMHTAQLLEFIDAEHAGDHADAYALEREAYPHMFDVGDALAKVIANRFPDRFPGVDVAYSAAGTLRVTLDRLLAEHAFLAAEAMRSGVSGAPDYEAAKLAIGANSTDLQAIVEAAYGAQAGSTFRGLWDGHIAGYVAYIGATRANDSAARATSTTQVNTYAAQLAGFLAGANPYLDPVALATLFQQHAGHLTGQVDAFAATDFDAMYALVREGYSHMFMAGEALAVGIATQMPKEFPTDAAAPDTATLPHPHADAPSGWIAFILLGLALLVEAGVLGAWLLGRATRSAQGRRPPG